MARPKKVQVAVFGISLAIGFMVVLVVVLVGRSVQAGSHLSGGGHFEPGYVYGSMGTMRATSDSAQFMRCEVTGADNGTAAGAMWVTCTFRQGPATPDAEAPPEQSCTSGNPAVIAAAQAVGDSMVTIYFNPSTGRCTSISIDATSEYAPKVP